MSACTPSRINNEGHPEDGEPARRQLRRSAGDWFGYRDVLERWLEDGTFEGLEIEVRTGAP